MKMSFHQQHRKDGFKGYSKKLPFLIIVCILVVIFLLRGPTSRLMQSIFSPLWKFEFFVIGSFSDGLELIRSKKVLITENEELKRNLEISDEIRLALDDALEKNLSLQDLLGRQNRSPRIVSVVLRRPPYTPYDSIFIDIGSKENVQNNNLVFSTGNTVIGDIVEVYDKSSVVSLFSSPGRETEVLVGNSSTPAKATGRGGGNFIIALPAEVDVKNGDPIRLPSLSSSVIGIIENIDTDSAESIQTIYFKNVFNLNELNIVLVEVGD